MIKEYKTNNNNNKPGINYCDIIWHERPKHIKIIYKSKGAGGGGVNENYSLHKESLGCINISQELEPKLILGPYTEHRGVLF